MVAGTAVECQAGQDLLLTDVDSGAEEGRESERACEREEGTTRGKGRTL